MDSDNRTERTQEEREERSLFARINWLPLIRFMVILYAFLQVYLMRYRGIDTVKALESYMNDSAKSQGIVCRKELILTKQNPGSVYYTAMSGERVSSGALIGSVYPSPEDVDRLTYLRNRQEILDDINTVTGYRKGTIMDVSVAKKQLNDRIAELSQSVSRKDYYAAFNVLGDLTLGINKIGFATGITTDFSPAREQLESEVAAIMEGISSPVEKLYSPRAGYFIRYTDGYEGIATVDRFLSLSYEEGTQLISSGNDPDESSGRYGKIITDYKWSLCTYIDTVTASKLKEGRSVSITISSAENDFKKGTIKHIVDMGERSLIVIECSVMDSSAALARVSECEILFKQYRGIKIPKTAIHFVDGEMGVYVNYSNVVKFKKINPMFEDDNYVIVPSTTSSDNQVKLYDSIIVKGRDLYDGKYL